jgi:hypothetical protein
MDSVAGFGAGSYGMTAVTSEEIVAAYAAGEDAAGGD